MGLIPAHAGKTCPTKPDRPASRAHPRSRGENCGATRAVMQQCGSSPLTRGKPRHRTHPAAVMRLIPAHAGKTRAGRSRYPLLRAHPRSRGENHVATAPRPARAGSSPLTRGKRHPPADRSDRRGLIPAHAGKTKRLTLIIIRPRAHPRSRGENASSMPRAREMPGSSPLTRGKLLGVQPLEIGRRLIPAHAGKTVILGIDAAIDGAHPRSRGENTRARSTRPTGAGSSPLTRGKQGRVTRLHCHQGLIPAHAGKTGTRSRPHCSSTAHPRSRGENTSRPALLLRRSIRSWKPLSLPSPLEVTQFGSLAQLTRRRIRFGVLASSFRVVGAHHECESIEVNGLPWVSPRQEGESLLVARPVDHDGTSGLHVLSDDVPQALAYTGAERPHEDPRGNLHEPPRHVTSQPLGHRGQDQDDHQESLSS